VIGCADCRRPPRAQLGDAAFAAAWAEGETLPIEKIIAEALEEAPDG
jgi:hypothetical protein